MINGKRKKKKKREKENVALSKPSTVHEMAMGEGKHKQTFILFKDLLGITETLPHLVCCP